MAAASIANIVKSSLGPVGLDKMLVDDIGVSAYVTSFKGIVNTKMQCLIIVILLHDGLYITKFFLLCGYVFFLRM